ncbi:unnamed protein product [Caenorhabditis sp. 36 PRJEB53466]|nr:unnamed protein product [Caenorhabditis sp. 36 PRJEB53466]
MTLVDVSCSPVSEHIRDESPEMAAAEEEQRAVAAAAVEPCTGCVQLHKNIKQNVEQIMSKMSKLESVCERIESLVAEKEKEQSSVAVGLHEHMSESGSEEKYAPSPSGSRGSPNPLNGKLVNGNGNNGGSRKRKPTKDSVNRVNALVENRLPLDNLLNGHGSPAEKLPNSRQTPVSASSPFPDFNNFNGFIFDPMANPQNMMQLLNLVQQQQQAQQQAQQQQQSQQKAEMQKIAKAEERQTVTVKQEPAETRTTPPSLNEQTLLDQLAAQFNGNAPSPTVQAAANASPEDDSGSSISRCSNCSTAKTTAWRRDLAGKLVCNACGLYYRLHRTHRPVHMRKDFIQQRFRRKIKEEESPTTSQSAMFSQLLGLPQMASGNGSAAAFSLLEQFNQLN